MYKRHILDVFRFPLYETFATPYIYNVTFFCCFIIEFFWGPSSSKNRHYLAYIPVDSGNHVAIQFPKLTGIGLHLVI